MSSIKISVELTHIDTKLSSKIQGTNDTTLTLCRAGLIIAGSNENKQIFIQQGNQTVQVEETDPSTSTLPEDSEEKEDFFTSLSWGCIDDTRILLVGYNSGILRCFSSSGQLLVSQWLHADRIVQIKPYLSGPTSEESSHGLLIVYPRIIIWAKGIDVITSFKSSLLSIKTTNNPNEIKHTWNYRKWKVSKQYNINDSIICNPILPNNLNNPWQPYRTLPCIITTGNSPVISYYMPSEDSSSMFSAVSLASSITRQLASAAFSFAKKMLWNSTPDTITPTSTVPMKPNTELAESISGEKSFSDPKRIGNRIIVSPNLDYSIITDNYGRVCLIDIIHVVIIRIWKGYREAQCKFIQIPVKKDYENKQQQLSKYYDTRQPLYHLYLLIHAPRRGLLELWGVPYGTRVSAVKIPIYSKLCHAVNSNDKHIDAHMLFDDHTIHHIKIKTSLYVEKGNEKLSQNNINIVPLISSKKPTILNPLLEWMTSHSTQCKGIDCNCMNKDFKEFHNVSENMLGLIGEKEYEVILNLLLGFIFGNKNDNKNDNENVYDQYLCFIIVTELLQLILREMKIIKMDNNNHHYNKLLTHLSCIMHLLQVYQNIDVIISTPLHDYFSYFTLIENTKHNANDDNKDNNNDDDDHHTFTIDFVPSNKYYLSKILFGISNKEQQHHSKPYLNRIITNLSLAHCNISTLCVLSLSWFFKLEKDYLEQQLAKSNKDNNDNNDNNDDNNDNNDNNELQYYINDIIITLLNFSDFIELINNITLLITSENNITAGIILIQYITITVELYIDNITDEDKQYIISSLYTLKEKLKHLQMVCTSARCSVPVSYEEYITRTPYLYMLCCYVINFKLNDDYCALFVTVDEVRDIINSSIEYNDEYDDVIVNVISDMNKDKNKDDNIVITVEQAKELLYSVDSFIMYSIIYYMQLYIKESEDVLLYSFNTDEFISTPIISMYIITKAKKKLLLLLFQLIMHNITLLDDSNSKHHKTTLTNMVLNICVHPFLHILTKIVDVNDETDEKTSKTKLFCRIIRKQIGFNTSELLDYLALCLEMAEKNHLSLSFTGNDGINNHDDNDYNRMVDVLKEEKQYNILSYYMKNIMIKISKRTRNPISHMLHIYIILAQMDVDVYKLSKITTIDRLELTKQHITKQGRKFRLYFILFLMQEYAYRSPSSGEKKRSFSRSTCVLSLAEILHVDMEITRQIHVKKLLERGEDEQAEDTVKLLSSKQYSALIMLSIARLRLGLWIYRLQTVNINEYNRIIAKVSPKMWTWLSSAQDPELISLNFGSDYEDIPDILINESINIKQSTNNITIENIVDLVLLSKSILEFEVLSTDYSLVYCKQLLLLVTQCLEK